MSDYRPIRWKIGDAVDEWAHRRLGFGMVTSENGCVTRWYWRLTPFPWLCNRRELSYGVPIDIVYPGSTSSGNSIQWQIKSIHTWVRPHHTQPPPEGEQ